jgi:hypothetical protein
MFWFGFIAGWAVCSFVALGALAWFALRARE